MQTMGILLATVALFGVIIRGSRLSWPWTAFVPRILALVGELIYFGLSSSPVFALCFVAGAVWTVTTWFRDRHANIGGVVELMELLAWAWMALALH